MRHDNAAIELRPSANLRFRVTGPEKAKGGPVPYKSTLYWTDVPGDPECPEEQIFFRYVRAGNIRNAARQALRHMSRWTGKSKPPMDLMPPWIRDAVLEELESCRAMLDQGGAT